MENKEMVISPYIPATLVGIFAIFTTYRGKPDLFSWMFLAVMLAFLYITAWSEGKLLQRISEATEASEKRKNILLNIRTNTALQIVAIWLAFYTGSLTVEGLRHFSKITAFLIK